MTLLNPDLDYHSNGPRFGADGLGTCYDGQIAKRAGQCDLIHLAKGDGERVPVVRGEEVAGAQGCEFAHHPSPSFRSP